MAPVADRPAKRGVTVWDVPVRVFHWLLVASVAAASVSGFLLPVNWLTFHLIAGSTVAALVLWRLVWGFTGSTYSRFASFFYGPHVVLAHLRAVARGDKSREAGHNPLGAMMVFALLPALSGIVITGVAVLGGAYKQGPLKSFLSFSAGWGARDIHGLLAYVLLALVAGHIAGVVFESTRTGENLAVSMVTGRKRAGLIHVLMPKRPAVAATHAVCVVLAVTSIGGSYWLSLLPAHGVPAMSANAAWATECSACHIAFHPSLLPDASWRRMMAGLEDHFGEDASLDAATAPAITAFLAANASEHWDTLPANRLRAVNTEKPLEITATAFWTRTHAKIGSEVFAAKPVGAKQNCAACHGDAVTGMFAPQNIDIPEETVK